MKILYAIQGTGNGHMSRADEILEALRKKCMVDVLISGTQTDLNLQYPVKYQLKGLSFVFGKKGGGDIWSTLRRINFFKLYKEIAALPVENYDLIINDFEPVSAWAGYIKKVPCISLSHQSAILNDNSPRPINLDKFGYNILKYFAPTNHRFSFHFLSYGNNMFTPIIRKEIREYEKEDLGHITVYLPAYSDDKLISSFNHFKKVRWQIFSKHTSRTYSKDNVEIFPISKDLFTWSLAKSTGVLCGAGFETPSEALYLGKKLMVVPMKQQIEQQYNAAALKEIGVPVIDTLSPKNFPQIQHWLNSNSPIEIKYPDISESVVNKLLLYYINNVFPSISQYSSNLPVEKSKQINNLIT